MASIYQRGNIWWVRYSPSLGARPIQQSLKTKDKTVAKYKKNEIENRLARGDNPLPDKSYSVDDALKLYAEDSRHRKTSKTIIDDENRLKAFFVAAGINKIVQIKEHALSKYIQERLGRQEISLTTANHTIKTAKAFLNFCLKRNLIGSNPIRGMKRYKTEKTKPRFLSTDEIRDVLYSCRTNKIFPMVLMAIYTGMRFSELLNVQWNDIDLLSGTITVPKSKAGRFRIIPIHEALRATLTKKNIPFEWLAGYTAIRLLREVTKRTDIGWHTFRHTFASHLVMKGVDIVTVGKLLGHSRIETTMIYSHLSDDHVKESIRKLNF